MGEKTDPDPRSLERKRKDRPGAENTSRFGKAARVGKKAVPIATAAGVLYLATGMPAAAYDEPDFATTFVFDAYDGDPPSAGGSYAIVPGVGATVPINVTGYTEDFEIRCRDKNGDVIGEPVLYSWGGNPNPSWKGSIHREPFHLANKGSIHRELF